MNERDERILKHIGKYGVSIRAVIEKLFFDGATCDHVINRLVAEKRIASQTGIPGGLSYYRLTLTEVRSRCLPEHRARPKKGAALRMSLQVLWFCCLSDKSRNRIDGKKVRELFGNGNGCGKPHCAEVEDEQSLIYRIYAPGPNSRDDYLVKCLRSDADKTIQKPELQSWIDSKAFVFAVLVETAARKERLKRLISKDQICVRVLVEVIPGFSNLATEIRKFQEASSATRT